jgi:hypothetical protein
MDGLQARPDRDRLSHTLQYRQRRVELLLRQSDLNYGQVEEKDEHNSCNGVEYVLLQQASGMCSVEARKSFCISFECPP